MAYLESLILKDSSGTEADVTVANALKVDGSAVTQPVSDASGSLTIDNANLDVALSTRLKAADTLAGVTLVGTLSTITNVVHIDDNSSTLSIDDGGGIITVDGTVAFSNTTIAVTQSTSPWVISGAVTNTVLSVVGGGTEATAQRVTIASDSTGVLSIDDNGGSLTIDGTVAFSNTTIDLGASSLAALELIGIKGADGSTIAANANPLPISDAAGSITVDNAGTFAVQSSPVTQADTFMLGGVNIKEINAVTPLMGSGIMGTGSLRVTIASDNDAVTVKQATAANLNATVVGTGTFATQLTGATNNINNILGTVSLPTGAATGALQTTGNTSLASIDAGIPTTLGQTTMAQSMPVVLASDQTNINVVFPTAQRININQVAGTATDAASGASSSGTLRVILATDQPVIPINDNASSLTIDTAAIPTTIGQQPMANSLGVVLSSNQSAIPITTIIPGTGSTNLGKSEDLGHTSGDTGVFILAVRNDTQAALTNADTDYSPISVDSKGAVSINDGGNSLTVDNLGTFVIQDTTSHEGSTEIQIMAQVLMELRIMNQYLCELPQELQRSLVDYIPNKTNSTKYVPLNEPEEYREDKYFGQQIQSILN